MFVFGISYIQKYLLNTSFISESNFAVFHLKSTDMTNVLLSTISLWFYLYPTMLLFANHLYLQMFLIKDQEKIPPMIPFSSYPIIYKVLKPNSLHSSSKWHVLWFPFHEFIFSLIKFTSDYHAIIHLGNYNCLFILMVPWISRQNIDNLWSDILSSHYQKF